MNVWAQRLFDWNIPRNIWISTNSNIIIIVKSVAQLIQFHANILIIWCQIEFFKELEWQFFHMLLFLLSLPVSPEVNISKNERASSLLDVINCMNWLKHTINCIVSNTYINYNLFIAIRKSLVEKMRETLLALLNKAKV